MTTKRRVRGSLAILLVALGLAAAVWASTHRTSTTVVATLIVRGRIAERLVQDGDWVQQGQLVAVLDTRALEAQLAQAERELKMQRAQSQAAIKPVFPVDGITGLLPSALPRPETLDVPANAPPLPSPKEDDLRVAARKSQAQAQRKMESASEAVAKATSAVDAAQEARNALSPKLVKAQLDAKLAAAKAAPADDLFAQGAISRHRLEALRAAEGAASKVVDGLQGQLSDADEALSTARSQRNEANIRFDEATKERAAAGSNLLRLQTMATKASPAKPIGRRTKLVTRRTPVMVQPEASLAIPLTVNVDSAAMKASQMNIAKLERRIAELKAKIGSSHLEAPASGRILFAPDGAIQILQTK